MSFRPTIESVTPEELSFCVGGVEWGRPGDAEPLEFQAPYDDADDECYALAPEAVSGPVWENWGISPCSYDTLGLNIGTSIESFQYTDGHPDHDEHFGSVDGGLVEWPLGQGGDALQVDPDDVLDIVVHLDIAESDGRDEFELVAAGTTGL